MRTQDKWMNLEKPNDDDGLLLSGKRDIAAIHGSIEEISKYFPFLKLFFRYLDHALFELLIPAEKIP